MAEVAQPECNRIMAAYRVVAYVEVETGVAGTSYIWVRDLRPADDPTVTAGQISLRTAGTENALGDTQTGHFVRNAVSAVSAVYT